MSLEDSLVLGRAKRSTAGNRLRALLDKAHTLNAEEGFEEVEDDNDFEDNLEQKDVFDDDFASTDDEAVADELDPTTLEKRLMREERTQNQKEKRKGKGYHDPLAYLKKGPKKKKVAGGSKTTGEPDAVEVTGNVQDDDGDNEEREAKRRRVTIMVPSEGAEEDQDPDSAAEEGEEDEVEETAWKISRGRRGGLGRKTAQGEVRRSALRASTRNLRDEVDERAQEELARRAVHPLRGPRRPHPNRQLTQADLIALALEREDENRESLKDWLKKEEERRLKSKEKRKVVEGPRIRWISRVEGVEVVEVDGEVQAGLTGNQEGDTIEVAPKPPGSVTAGLPQGDMLEVIKDSSAQEAPPPVPPASLAGVPVDIAPAVLPVASSSSPSTIPRGPANAQKHKNLPESSENAFAAETTGVSPEKGQAGPFTRNYLVLEEIRGGLKAEMDVILGDHVDWTRVPVVSTKNRTQTRRKTICPLTGIMASYRHPATHIPYASKNAYRAIENVLRSAYRWSSDHDAFLDFEGTRDGLGHIEVADGLMDEVEGWAEACFQGRKEALAEVEPINDHRDGETDDPPRADDPMDIVEEQDKPDQVIAKTVESVVKQEPESSKSKKTTATAASKRKPPARKTRDDIESSTNNKGIAPIVVTNISRMDQLEKQEGSARIKKHYHSLVVPAKWADLEDLFDAKAAELGNIKKTKTAGDIARRVGSGDYRMDSNQVAQLAVLTGMGPSFLTEDERRFFAAIEGHIICRTIQAGSLSACCLKLCKDLKDWAEEDPSRIIHPEFHRQEIVKHEECLHAIDDRKIQGK